MPVGLELETSRFQIRNTHSVYLDALGFELTGENRQYRSRYDSSFDQLMNVIHIAGDGEPTLPGKRPDFLCEDFFQRLGGDQGRGDLGLI